MLFGVKTNISKVSKKMELLPKKVSLGISIAIRKSAFLVERYSKRFSPVDTGRMRSSIASDIRPMIAIIRPNVDYAVYVHEGTRFMKARPFMKQGRESAEAEISRVFRKEVSKALE